MVRHLPDEVKLDEPLMEQRASMGCPVYANLLDEFATATSAYFEAVSYLSSISGEPAFSEAYRLAKQEYEHCRRTRADLELHCASHGCLDRLAAIPMGSPVENSEPSISRRNSRPSSCLVRRSKGLSD